MICILCNRINNGYIGNLKNVNIPYKKKYIDILSKLSNLNYIKGFHIKKEKNLIIVSLKYYNNKPLIFLESISKNSYKKYYKFKNLNKNPSFFNQVIYSSNKGFFYKDECILFKIGGEAMLKIYFLYKNIL